MEQETLQQLNKHFNQLPKEVKDILLSLDLDSSLMQIQETKPLNEVQKIAIENEIMLIFLGLRDIQSLTTNIKYTANISHDRAEKISKGVEQNILLPNQEMLEQVFDVHGENNNMNTKTSDGIASVNSTKNDVVEKTLNSITSTNLIKNNEIKTKSIIPQIFKKRLPKIKKSEPETEIKNDVSRFKPKINNNDPYREPIE